MEPRTIPDLFWWRVQTSPRNLAYRYVKGGNKVEVTWEEYGNHVRRFGNGLLSLGFQKGDRVAIMGETQPEWTIADLAAMCAGGTGVGIYQTNTAKQAEYILDHSEAKVCVVDSKVQAAKVIEAVPRLKNLKALVSWGDGAGVAGEGVLTFEEVMKRGDEFAASNGRELDTRMAGIQPEDLAILIYTSGTTGPPKGAMLSHGNCIYELKALAQLIPSDLGDITVAFLPMSHVAEHLVGFMGRINTGMAASYAPSLDKVLETVNAAQPTVFGSVPRIFEKAYAKILSQVEQASPGKKKIFNWAKEVGLERSRCFQEKRPVPIGLTLKYTLADRLVFSKIRQAFGGKVKYFVSGAAPISTEILEFFHAAGLFVAEVYGLTECAAIGTVNRLDDYKFGTVGKAIPGCEVTIADDGEILIRGKNVFMGYFKDEEGTREAIDAEGWLHSGDIGYLDGDGFLKITDRKKNIIVTAGGKNVAPSNIEILVRNGCPLISQVLVIGDRRPCLVALITLNPDELTAYAKEKALDAGAVEAPSRNPVLRGLVESAVAAANRELARYEQIKEFEVLDRDFTIEAGEITPSLKVKRKVVQEKYADMIDRLYR